MPYTAADSAPFETGDTIWARPVREGKAQARRKGIVLGYFAEDPSCGLVVWWFGMGAASMDTSSLMFARELVKDGDIFDFGARQSHRLMRGCYHYDRARAVGFMLQRHAARMKAAGVL